MSRGKGKTSRSGHSRKPAGIERSSVAWLRQLQRVLPSIQQAATLMPLNLQNSQHRHLDMHFLGTKEPQCQGWQALSMLNPAPHKQLTTQCQHHLHSQPLAMCIHWASGAIHSGDQPCLILFICLIKTIVHGFAWQPCFCTTYACCDTLCTINTRCSAMRRSYNWCQWCHLLAT